MIKDISKKQSTKVTLNKNIALPKDRYTLLCKDETFSLSKSSGNPMVTRVFEFITESADLPDGTKLILGGAEITKYYPLKSNGTAKNTPEAATAMCIDNFREDTKLCAPSEEIDWTQFDDEHPPLVMKGKVVDALCGDEEQVERKTPTPGKRMGDPIIDPRTNKPRVTHQAKILEFYGASTTTTVPQTY